MPSALHRRVLVLAGLWCAGAASAAGAAGAAGTAGGKG
jgi:hypothetical protein